MFPGLFLILYSLVSSLHSQNIKDSTFYQYNVSFKFPISKGWHVGVIEIKGGDVSKDSSYIQEVEHFKIGVSPGIEFHAFVTIVRNEYKLNTSFDKFVQLRMDEYKADQLTILDTSIFKHKGLEAFQIISRWQNLGFSIYSFSRTWYIYKEGFISRISFECDETTYSKFFSTAIKIMKSVVLE